MPPYAVEYHNPLFIGSNGIGHFKPGENLVDQVLWFSSPPIRVAHCLNGVTLHSENFIDIVLRIEEAVRQNGSSVDLQSMVFNGHVQSSFLKIISRFLDWCRG